jgi:hypothetical protein
MKVRYTHPNQLALGFFLGAVLTLLLTLITWGSYPTTERIEIVSASLFCLGLYPAICLADYVGHRLHAAKTIVLRLAATVLLAAAVGISGWKSLPSPPIIAMQISPLALPLSIPAHSVACVLRVHPFFGLTEKQDDLLKVANNTGTEGCWPSKAEIDSTNVSGHEIVYRLEISNHSQRILESGKLTFALKYGSESKGGNCLPPSGTQHDQDDVVLLPPIDPGKSFEFYAVNESNMCAWLIPPNSAAVTMDGDGNDDEITLTFDKNPLYATGAPSFSPTVIKWEGIPARPGGYGIIRTGSSSCESTRTSN